MMFKRLVIRLLLIGLCGAATGCATRGQNLSRFEFSEIIMGVEARVVFFAESESRARELGRAAFDRMIELDGVMSDYRPDSELMRAVRHALATPGTPVAISADLAHVLTRSQQIAAASRGAFDVTVGPVVQVWRQARSDQKLPDPAALAQARRAVGWRMLHVPADKRTMVLDRADMRLDLGGIGKGFAADEALAALRARGCTRAMIDLGGDVVLGTPPPGKPGWAVQVQDGAGNDHLLQLSSTAIATSGDTEQFIEIGGVRYSHIVDPHTGLGLTNRIAVTVIAPDGATADALASAISVLGEDIGPIVASEFSGVRVMVRRVE